MVLKQIQQEAIVKPLLFTSQGTNRDPKGRRDGLSLEALRLKAGDESHMEAPSTQDNSAKQPVGQLDKTESQPHFQQAIIGTETNLTWWVHSTGSLTVAEPQFAAIVHNTMHLWGSTAK